MTQCLHLLHTNTVIWTQVNLNAHKSNHRIQTAAILYSCVIHAYHMCCVYSILRQIRTVNTRQRTTSRSAIFKINISYEFYDNSRFRCHSRRFSINGRIYIMYHFRRFVYEIIRYINWEFSNCSNLIKKDWFSQTKRSRLLSTHLNDLIYAWIAARISRFIENEGISQSRHKYAIISSIESILLCTAFLHIHNVPRISVVKKLIKILFMIHNRIFSRLSIDSNHTRIWKELA